MWRADLEESEVSEVMSFINNWNSTRFWPKAYMDKTHDDFLYVHAEVNVDYAPGLSDDQLVQHLLCALQTSSALFQELSENFPPIWKRFQAKVEAYNEGSEQ